MAKMKLAPTKPSLRAEEWVAPTGRTLVKGGKFKAEGFRGNLVFLAYVTPDRGYPFVEAVDSRRRIRCIRPDAVHTVANKKD